MSPSEIALFDNLIALVQPVIIAVIGVILTKYVKDADARAVIKNVVDNAANKALEYGQAQGDQFLSQVHIKSAGLAAGLQYATDQAQPAIDHFKLSDADMTSKIAGALAEKLSVATPIPAAAPVVVADPVVAAAVLADAPPAVAASPHVVPPVAPVAGAPLTPAA
jgi:hypothetical protein